MPSDISIISVNFRFEMSGVDNVYDISTELALFDYDVAVIRPHSLKSFMEYKVNDQGDKTWIVRSDFERLSAMMKRKSAEITRLWDQGGILVVILDCVERYHYFSGRRYSPNRTLYNISNYDFLAANFHQCVQNGSGGQISITNSANSFAKLLSRSKVKWTSYIIGKPVHPFSGLKMFARNGSGAFVGGIVQTGNGHTVFLPNLEIINETLFLEISKDYRFKREGTPAPTWVDSVWLPKEEDADKTISGIEQQLDDLSRLRDEAMLERAALLVYKKLLYEKGKAQLEPTVRDALDKLEFQTTPSEIIANSNYEIDGRTRAGSVPGILEIKGSKKQIALDDFSSFIPKLLKDFEVTGTQSKGIFVGNGLCTEWALDRLGNNVFSSHVIDAAESHSIALVNSVELYWIISSVLSGEITDFEPIRESVLAKAGYIDLKSFCGKNPFEHT